MFAGIDRFSFAGGDHLPPVEVCLKVLVFPPNKERGLIPGRVSEGVRAPPIGLAWGPLGLLGLASRLYSQQSPVSGLLKKRPRSFASGVQSLDSKCCVCLRWVRHCVSSPHSVLAISFSSFLSYPFCRRPSLSIPSISSIHPLHLLTFHNSPPSLLLSNRYSLHKHTLTLTLTHITYRPSSFHLDSLLLHLKQQFHPPSFVPSHSPAKPQTHIIHPLA